MTMSTRRVRVRGPVADSAHHSLVERAADAETVLRRIVSGERGRSDGGPASASFAEPGGLALLPPEVAAAVGYDAVVADTANHLLRGVRLADGRVRTVTGTGSGGTALEVDLTSPCDVAGCSPAPCWAACFMSSPRP
ncbi:hypothetical protein [Gandjariella thermophila]|uniref:Uncharacterized protein n=1 Tax=Gandjariella thermophila TaxID=1931992 RepID=A0A4D4J2I7_9PSEU|nr:hypothetical protein GTS_24680 [Gandjariella thermophila]